MSSRREYQRKENGCVDSTITNMDIGVEDKQRAELVGWLNGLVPHLSLPLGASDEELRACLDDGAVLCDILKMLNPRSIDKGSSSDSAEPHLARVKKFLSVMDEMGLPSFEVSDLEQGSMTKVLKCLLTLRAQINSNVGGENIDHLTSENAKSGDVRTKDCSQTDLSSRVHSSSLSEPRKSSSSFKRVLCSPVMPDPSAAMIHHVGHKFHEVFQLKQGRYADLPAANISEMMKSTSLDNAPTQSLLSVVNGILDESIDRKNGEIPHRVACLLRKVVQEIERRISTQAEHLRTQNNLYKAREEKYQSRIRVLETLATGTSEDNQIGTKKAQQIKTKSQKEESSKVEEQDIIRLMKEKDDCDLEISALKQEVELTKKKYEERCQLLEEQGKESQHELKERLKELQVLLTSSNGKEKELEILALKQEVDTTKKKYEERCLLLGEQAKETKHELEGRLKELEILLTNSREKEKELKKFSALEAQNWYKKESSYQRVINIQLGALREIRMTSQYIKEEVVNTEKSYLENFSRLGVKLKALADAAGNFDMVLAENRRLHNEVQDLKGNIRVYCRIRPSFSGPNGKKTIIDYIGDNGELAVANPTKQGKESRRSFKFNKVYGPSATQEEVFLDTRPLVRSVLDGYNVCIFAYGQTGSGKTYTMMGPNKSSSENWGVNYRALNDLFDISWNRRSTFAYEVGVQMIEIYNEQVRDLLTSDSSQKRLEIRTTNQASGLAVPDAVMHAVKSTTDVMDLMQIGLNNRAVSSTAMNERSSRSHSVVTVHVRGTELKTGAVLRGSLHLVDLAGSERVDRSEVTGDRLKEAQHINKSLSALGDVIFALSQKSSHIPYRNSKLTQVLQSSLGGQAKTLMFVQLNPEPDSFSESLSTLKFAERVSGVELGAARSNKEGKDVRELMDQVASLKDTIAKKDEEIEHLQLLKDLRTASPRTSSLRHGSSSPSINSLVGSLQHGHRGGKSSGLSDKASSDLDNCSEYSDKQSEAGSHQSVDDFRHDTEERSTDASDGDNEGSLFDMAHFPEGAKAAESTDKLEGTRTRKLGQRTLSRPSSAPKDLSKASRSLKKTVTTISAVKALKRPAMK